MVSVNDNAQLPPGVIVRVSGPTDRLPFIVIEEGTEMLGENVFVMSNVSLQPPPKV